MNMPITKFENQDRYIIRSKITFWKVKTAFQQTKKNREEQKTQKNYHAEMRRLGWEYKSGIEGRKY